MENQDELKIGQLPRLSIMPIGDILVHEEPDVGRVARLIDCFGQQGILRNPVVVAVVDGNPRRLLLDGTNRSAALTKLGVADVLVQEVELEDRGLIVSQWHHAIENLASDALREHLARVPGLFRINSGSGAEDGNRNFVCRIGFSDGAVASLAGTGDLLQDAGLLRRFTSLYSGSSQMDRVSYTNPADLRRNYPRLSALVSFRRFTKADIVRLTDAGERLPSGITRVLLPKRALNFNLRLDVLKSGLSTAEKNEWLQNTIRHRVMNKSIRFYREPTFSFDE
ncbi:MAG: hypothetical protein JSW03_07120 [Candidatus Eiseniibacteriota bacterium]|nr:MAG: hypothetical protein JSW03_07120 [Candidatus Eisenbacteria bacterium]